MLFLWPPLQRRKMHGLSATITTKNVSWNTLLILFQCSEWVVDILEDTNRNANRNLNCKSAAALWLFFFLREMVTIHSNFLLLISPLASGHTKIWFVLSALTLIRDHWCRRAWFAQSHNISPLATSMLIFVWLTHWTQATEPQQLTTKRVCMHTHHLFFALSSSRGGTNSLRLSFYIFSFSQERLLENPSHLLYSPEP
jgi:hypothetical protein